MKECIQWLKLNGTSGVALLRGRLAANFQVPLPVRDPERGAGDPSSCAESCLGGSTGFMAPPQSFIQFGQVSRIERSNFHDTNCSHRYDQQFVITRVRLLPDNDMPTVSTLHAE